MLIRVEIPVDASGIDLLLRRSFPSGQEADLVQSLRENGLLALGIVATDDDGQVIGYAAFSPVDIAGEDHQCVGLAPLAVDENYRGQGLGRQLICEGLDSLNEFGYTAVVVLGDPAYYSKVGFVLAEKYQLSCLWPEHASAFQVYPLAVDRLSELRGRVDYSAPFAALSC